MATKKEIWHTARVKAKLRKALPEALIVTGQFASDLCKDLCPVDTGRLRSSITYATSKERGSPTNEGGVVATEKDLIGQPKEWNHLLIGTAVEYAPHVEFGTRKHTIVPRNKEWLIFPIRDRETHRILRWVKTKKVTIPKIKRQSFLRMGVLGNRGLIGKVFKRAMKMAYNAQSSGG